MIRDLLTLIFLTIAIGVTAQYAFGESRRARQIREAYEEGYQDGVATCSASTPTPTITATPTITPTGTPSPTATPSPGENPPIPLLGIWESNMLNWGAFHASEDKILAEANNEIGVWYYDGAWAFMQMSDYLNNTDWDIAAHWVLETYWPMAEGGTNGRRVFPDGLANYYIRYNDVRSLEALYGLANDPSKGVYCCVTGWEPDWVDSRGVAYAIRTMLLAEELGNEPKPYLPSYIDWALSHLDTFKQGGAGPDGTKPFMMALTAEALIKYYQKTGDPRILPAIQSAFDWLWEDSGLLMSEQKTFAYNYDMEAAPDLNMLIAPVYGWLWKETCDSKYMTRGDILFQGGVQGAWLQGGKQFAQHYKWSFDYVKWRQEACIG